jgi:hypothetical protein
VLHVHEVCAPGYHGTTCQACPIDSWCAGAAAAEQPCGSCMGTAGGRGARSPTDCLTKPGCGTRLGGSGSQLCPNGTYSTGGDHTGCLQCPAGLTTSKEGSTTINDCASPPGYLWQVRKEALLRPCCKVLASSTASAVLHGVHNQVSLPCQHFTPAACLKACACCLCAEHAAPALPHGVLQVFHQPRHLLHTMPSWPEHQHTRRDILGILQRRVAWSHPGGNQSDNAYCCAMPPRHLQPCWYGLHHLP